MRASVWQLILDKALPHLIKGASDLAVGSARRSAAIAAASDVRALRDQVADLSKDQQAQAALVKDLADQLSLITQGAQAIADKARLAVILGCVGIAVSVVALVLALVR